MHVPRDALLVEYFNDKETPYGWVECGKLRAFGSEDGKKILKTERGKQGNAKPPGIEEAVEEAMRGEITDGFVAVYVFTADVYG